MQFKHNNTDQPEVNFVDVETNLDTSTYQLCMKTDNMPAYITKKSNHPPAIMKDIPKTKAKRISEISSSEVVFNESIPIYSDAIRKSGFHDNITFIQKTANTKTNKKKSRNRKIMWFNP